MSLKFTNAFEPDFLKKIKEIEKGLEGVGLAAKKMGEDIVLSAKKSGKAYQENEAMLKALTVITTAQVKIEKEKAKVSKDSNKLINDINKQTKKQNDVQTKLLNVSKQATEANIKLNKAKREGTNIGLAYNKAIKAQTEKLKLLKKGNGELNNKYLIQEKKLKQLKQGQKDFNKNIKEQNKLVGVADDSIARMSSELRKLNKAYNTASEAGRKKLTPTIQKLDAKLKGLDAKVGKYQRSVGNYGKAFQKLSGTLGTFGVGLGAAAIAMKGIQIGKDAVNKVLEFEAGMSRVQAITNASDDSIQKLTQSAKDFGRTSVFSATQVTEAMVALGQAGLTDTEIMDALDGTLNLAAAGNIELSEAADIATNVMGGFGLQASDTGMIMDQLAKISTSSNTTISSLGESFKQIAPTMRTLGVPLEEIGAAVGVLGNSGISGTDATTSLNSSLLRLTKTTPQMQKAMDDLGVDFFDANGEFVGMNETIKQLEVAFKDLTPEQKLSNLATIFGTKANKQWSTLVAEGSDALTIYTEELRNSTGAAADMANTMTDNVQGAITRLNSAYEGLILSFQLGEGGMQKSIQDFIDMAAGVINLAAETNFLGKAYGVMLEPIFELLQSLAGIVGLFGDAEEATGGLSDGMRLISGVFDILIATTKMATRPMRLILALLNDLLNVFQGKFEFKTFDVLMEPLNNILSVLSSITGLDFGSVNSNLNSLKDAIFGIQEAVESAEGSIAAFTGLDLLNKTNFELQVQARLNKIALAKNEEKAKKDKIIADEKSKKDKEANEKYKKYLAEQDRLYELYLASLKDGRIKDELAEEFRLKKEIRGVQKGTKEMEYLQGIHNNNMLKIEEQYSVSSLEIEQKRISLMQDSREKDNELEWLAFQEKKENAKGDNELLELIKIEHRHNLQKIERKWNDNDLALQQELLEKKQELDLSNFNTTLIDFKGSEEEKAKLIKEFQVNQLAEKIAFLKKDEELNQHQIKLLENEIIQLSNVVDKNGKNKSLLELFGINDDNQQLEKVLKKGMSIVLDAQSKIAQEEIESTKKQIEARNENIDNLESALNTELQVQLIKQEAGTAYDLTKIENLQKNIEAEKLLKEQQEADLVKRQKKAVLIQLGADQASAIGSAIAAASANPLNATNPFTYYAQLAASMISIFANFKIAQSKMKGFADGGYTGDGTYRDETGERVAGVVHEKEFVINKHATKNIGLHNLDLLNKGVLPYVSESSENDLLFKNNDLAIKRNDFLRKLANKKEKPKAYKTLPKFPRKK